MKLREIRLADWNEHRSIRVGESAGKSAFWAVAEDGNVDLLIGHDDETCDVAVRFPPEGVDEIVREIERDA